MMMTDGASTRSTRVSRAAVFDDLLLLIITGMASGLLIALVWR
jgi:hypothetical protein